MELVDMSLDDLAALSERRVGSNFPKGRRFEHDSKMSFEIDGDTEMPKRRKVQRKQVSFVSVFNIFTAAIFHKIATELEASWGNYWRKGFNNSEYQREHFVRHRHWRLHSRLRSSCRDNPRNPSFSRIRIELRC